MGGFDSRDGLEHIAEQSVLKGDKFCEVNGKS